MASVRALAPRENVDVLRWSAIAAQNVGDDVAAIAYFGRALALLPDDAGLHVGMGVAQYHVDRQDEALPHLRLACQLAPSSAVAWYNLAEALQAQGRAPAAVDALRRSLELDPSNLPVQIALARGQMSLGEVVAASTGLREVLRQAPGNAEAWYALANLQTVDFDEQDLQRLALALVAPDLSPRDRIRLEFVRARLLEGRGEYARSFEVLKEANTFQHTLVRWDSAGERRRAEAILSVFAQPISSAPDRAFGAEVIFVASLPRSGSTLIEQILATHPDVDGANEIDDMKRVMDAETSRRRSTFPAWVAYASPQDWQRLGMDYLARTVRWRERKPRFTDKNLLNWMLIGAELSMLPGSHVVVVRRDPVETCLGCYRQWFDHGAEFSYDLDELADVYADFWRLTRYWLHEFPDRVFDLEYERLVAEPEPTIRRLLDFLGLPFEPACLEFYKTPRTVLSAPSAAQVRQPLHNTARAARYGHLLDGLRAKLRAAGLAVRDVE